MICKNCGKYNPDDSKFCKNCGCELGYETQSCKEPEPSRPSTKYGEDKTTIGVLLSFFLGILGLIIGLLLYPSESYERKTFLSGWTKTFVVVLIVSVVIAIISVGCTTCALSDYMGDYYY